MLERHRHSRNRGTWCPLHGYSNNNKNHLSDIGSYMYVKIEE